MAYTLDNMTSSNIFMGDLRLVKHGQKFQYTDLRLPRGGPNKIDPTTFAPYLNRDIDIRAPGIREQIPDPSRPNLGPYKSNLYERYDTSFNNNPIPDYKHGLSPAVSGPWAMRYGSAMFDILQETGVREHWLFRDFGQFNREADGFTALKDLSLSTTRGSFLSK